MTAAEFGDSTVEGVLPTLETDVFRGYFLEDVERVRRIVPKKLTPDPAYFTDVMGLKVSHTICPWVWNRMGVIDERLPFPNDSYIGEGIEYTGFAFAVEAAKRQSTFTAAELGAGWGPWVALAALSAQRLGFKQARVVGFEADPGRYQAMRTHFAINGLVPAEAPAIGRRAGLDWALHQAAAHWEDGTLYWPADSNKDDAGMAAIHDANAAQDYRGQPIKTVAVPAVSVVRAFADFDRVDFMHVDIQGGEAELLPRLLDMMNRKVAFLLVGTHSRKIEGDFIEMFGSLGWNLLRERPCQFHTMAPAPTLAGRTYMDGAQLWANARIGR